MDTTIFGLITACVYVIFDLTEGFFQKEVNRFFNRVFKHFNGDGILDVADYTCLKSYLTVYLARKC